MCTCQNKPLYNPCNVCNSSPCPPEVECDCPVKDLSTDCSTYKGEDLECSGIKKGTILTEVLQQLDAFICEKFNDLANLFSIKNIGLGAKIYKGTDLVGRKELRTITSEDLSIVISENEDTIDLSYIPELPCITSSSLGVNQVDNCIEIENNSTYEVSDLQVGNSILGTTTVLGDVTTFNYKTLESSDNSVDITVNATNVDFSVTKPTLQNGVTTTVTGDGISTPYSTEVINLQKEINTFPYTITDADDKQTVFVDNGAVNVIINIPDGLVSNFSCCFIQRGTGEVTIQTSGVATLKYPSTLENKIKGENFWALVEKRLTNEDYYLIGSLKVL